MVFFIKDILLYIFEFLTPKEREKIKTTCKLFHEVYIKSLKTRNKIDSKKHIFFHLNDNEMVFYEIVNISKFVFLKEDKKDTIIKTKILFNKYGIPYCKFKRNYIYIYEKEYIKGQCEHCKKEGFFFECGIMFKYCKFKKECKRKLFYFIDPIMKIVVKNYCKHNFCTNCMFKLSFIYSKNNLFNTGFKTFIVASEFFNNKDFTEKNYLRNILMI
jgi:hypothetical protein